MSDAQDLLKVIKQAALEAVEAAGPVTVCSGVALGEEPLKIIVSSKIILTNLQLVKPKGIGKINEGDKVLLLREQGGQNYIILGVV